MFRLSPLLLCCLAIALLLPSAAYADQTDEALHLADRANDLIEQTNGRYEQIMDLWYRVTEIHPASPQAAQALPLLRKMAAGFDEILPKAMSVVDLLDEAMAMDIDPDLRTLLGKRKEVEVLRWHELWLLSDSVAKMQTLYGEWTRLSEAERDELYAQLDKNHGRDLEILSLEKQKQDAVAEYAEEEGLGGSSPWYLSEWFLSSVSLVLMVVPAVAAWLRRRRRRKGEPEWV